MPPPPTPPSDNPKRPAKKAKPSPPTTPTAAASPHSPASTPPAGVLRRAEPAATAVDRPQGTDAAFVANRLTALTHELANLLDGSMRCLQQARQSVGDQAANQGTKPPSVAAPGPTGTNPSPIPLSPAGGVSKRLDTVYHAMEQMAGLVKTTMSGLAAGGAVVGSRRGLVEDWSLAESVEHAAEVMRPVAAERGVQLEASVDPRLSSLPAGPVYAVLTAGIRNAIEAITCAGHRAGLVHVEATVDESGDREVRRTANMATGTTWVRLEILDDGVGPPPLPRGEENRVMEYGFSTKPSGLGIGLAMASDLVLGTGGTIELLPRVTPPQAGGTVVGAVLRVRLPVRGRQGRR